MNKPILYIIVPCFNEEAMLPGASSKLKTKLESLIESDSIHAISKIVFIDDGSKDKTWEMISELHKKNALFGGVKLSRNKGHQNALIAGLEYANDKADIAISIDADLQDDIDAIDMMVDEFKKGNEIVYGVRSSREADSIFKRNSAILFYKVMSRLGVDSIYNHADFRLMSARSIKELLRFNETNLFLRGIVPLIGFKSSTVEYRRTKRIAGDSKYPFKKMVNFAIDGITSFSVKPLRFVTALGLLVSLISFIVMAYSLGAKLSGHTVEGWTFTIVSVWFIGGVQMLSIGIVGEYIGKIYNEVKGRPRYTIEKEL